MPFQPWSTPGKGQGRRLDLSAFLSRPRALSGLIVGLLVLASLIFFAALPVPAVLQVPINPEGVPPRPATLTDGRTPLLIKHGWDIPSPQFVRDNAAAMDTSPFDGVVLTLPGLTAKIMSQTPMPETTLAAALLPLRGVELTHLTHNFVIAYATPAGSFFDDYSVPVANFGKLAAAARDAGLTGIYFDTETYFGSVWNWPQDCHGHTIEECQQQAQLRGRQVMDAIRAAWPDAQVITTFGAWVSDPRTADALHGVLNYTDISSSNEMMGPFVVGMVESTVGSTARIIDGGEIYTARTINQFATVYAWQKQRFPAESPLVPDSLKPEWATTVSAAFGVFDQPWLGASMDVETWQQTVTHAMDVADDYVWVYTERYNWWGTSWPQKPVPEAWVAATQAAKAAVSP